MKYSSWECQDSKDSTNTSKDSWRNLKTPKDIQSLPKIAEVETALTFASLNACFAKCTSLPLSIWRKKHCHLHIAFISYISLRLHTFGNCVKQSCNHSHFSIRLKTLALLKAWELAGIKQQHISSLLILTHAIQTIHQEISQHNQAHQVVLMKKYR